MDGDFRDQQIDTLSDDLGLDVAKHALAGRIEGLDDAVFIDGQDDVLDVIEDDLQMLRALLARLVRQRSRLVRHESHGLNDAAALVVDHLILRAHELQQQGELGVGGVGAGTPHPQSDFLQLRAQLRMKIGAVRRTDSLVGPDEGRRCPGARLSRRRIEGP